jgi:hypothetical protein
VTLFFPGKAPSVNRSNKQGFFFLTIPRRSEDDLAWEWGVSQQAVSKRKLKILGALQRQVRMP